MEITLSCQNSCEIEEAARDVVTRVVNQFRADGHKNEDAVALTADLFDTTPRKVWSLKYRHPIRVTREWHDHLVAKWWASQMRRAERMRREADELERQASAELRAIQPDLPLGVAYVESPNG